MEDVQPGIDRLGIL